MRFSEIAGASDAVMGVKAVWGRSAEPVMCFGSRGDERAKDKKHFMQARATAGKAIEQPWLVTIGGGDQVPPELDGRVIELVRVTGVYGETRAFVRDPALYERLRQWPVAVVLAEVYAIEGEPRLIDDLGFADRKILANAYDGVRRDNAQMALLWEALKDRIVTRRREVEPLPGFWDPGRVQLCGTLYPTVPAGSSEGRKVWKLQREAERDAALARAAREANRNRHGGVLMCEACGFADPEAAMFDAHHLEPLAAGVRVTRTDDLAVLCPTCHRWCHTKAQDRLQPLSIAVLRGARGSAA